MEITPQIQTIINDTVKEKVSHFKIEIKKLTRCNKKYEALLKKYDKTGYELAKATNTINRLRHTIRSRDEAIDRLKCDEVVGEINGNC